MRELKNAIELKNVGVLRDDRWILKNATWSVPAGSCAAILGPNGSGKSTLARVIMGHLWPTAGDVTILGQKFGETDLNALRESLRLVQSTGGVEFDAELSAHDLVLTGFFGTLGLYHSVTPAQQSAAIKMLRQVGLTKVASHPYRTLSTGERMRAMIARALVVQPKLLILDEPTSGLDLLAREQVLATVQRLFDKSPTRGGEPLTVLMITHHVEELPSATSEILLLTSGKVARQGKPKDVLRADVLSKVYKVPVTVARRAGRFYLHVNTNSEL